MSLVSHLMTMHLMAFNRGRLPLGQGKRQRGDRFTGSVKKRDAAKPRSVWEPETDLGRQ